MGAATGGKMTVVAGNGFKQPGLVAVTLQVPEGKGRGKLDFVPLGVVVAIGAEPVTGTGGVVQPVHKYVQLKAVVEEVIEFK